MFYEKTVLENGITVVTERMEGFHSATLGIWLGVGSRDEEPQTSGMSHFMEHMVFKGTPTRTAERINQEFDEIGAENNAFTSKECTCFHARVISEKLPEAVDILADMVQNALFEESCIESERKVVLEEIARSADEPESHVFDLAAETLWPDNQLGWPVLGPADNVAGFSHDDCVAYHDRNYTTGNVVVAAAGGLEHDQVVDLVSQKLSGLPRGERNKRPESVRPGSGLTVATKDTEQAHVVYSLPAIPADDPQRFAALVLDCVMGSGMSSRLFQEVREKRGLAYAVSSFASMNQGVGSFSAYVGTRPANLVPVLEIVEREFDKALASGITQSELDRAKAVLSSQVYLRSESTRTRMGTLGSRTVLCQKLMSLEERVAAIRSVTLDDVLSVAGRMLAGRPTIAVISPIEKEKVESDLARFVERA